MSKTFGIIILRLKFNFYIVQHYFILIIVLGGLSTAYTQFIDAEPTISDPSTNVELVVGGLSSHTSMAFVDSQSIIVLKKNSREVRLVSNSELKDEPILKLDVDLTTSTCCKGLLGIVVSTQNEVANIKEVFLYFTSSGNDQDPILNKIIKYEWDGRNLLNAQNILQLPATPGPHPGCKLILDKDGNLFTIVGDLNNEGVLQTIKEDNKGFSDSSVIIKVNGTDGLVLSDNPFTNFDIEYPSSQVAKYYGYGIRNSFGFDFDPVTGKLWDAENGQDLFDEINLVEPGFNSGWKQVMGPISGSIGVTENDMVILPGSYYGDPIFSWEPSLGVTDIEFFESKNLGDAYENNIFVGDINNGNLYYFRLNDNRIGPEFGSAEIRIDRIANEEEKDKVVWGRGFEGITDLETGPDGNLNVLSFDESQDGEGKIYRIRSDG